MRRFLCLLACTGMVWAGVACGALSGVDEFAVGVPAPVVGSGAAGGSGGSGGSGGDELSCPSGRGPAMVLGEGSWDPYCIDSTEVTIAQYAEFLASNPETTVSDVQCGWKLDNYVPRADGVGACAAQHSDAVGFPDHPIACVDWCDARKFCNWAGKRLCGRASGGNVQYNNLTDLANDEWYVACTADGKSNYPYGDDYVGARCVGAEYDASDESKPARSATACQGGFADLFDMSGNVHEWVDSCRNQAGVEPFNQACRARGGSFWDAAEYLTCAFAYDIWFRASYANNIGFRCCADAEAAM